MNLFFDYSKQARDPYRDLKDLLKLLWFAFSGEEKPPNGDGFLDELGSVLKINIHDQDMRLFEVEMFIKQDAAFGAFLGAKCANIDIVMTILRKQQFLKHNRYIKFTLHKVDERGVAISSQHFFDKTVVKKT